MKKFRLLPEHELYRYLVKAALVVIMAYGIAYYNSPRDSLNHSRPGYLYLRRNLQNR